MNGITQHEPCEERLRKLERELMYKDYVILFIQKGLLGVRQAIIQNNDEVWADEIKARILDFIEEYGYLSEDSDE